MKKSRRRKGNLIRRSFGFQPGLALGVLGLVIMIGGIYLTASASNVPTVRTCQPVRVQDVTLARPTASQVAYHVSAKGQGKPAYASVRAGSNCVGYLISLVSYQTPAASSLPYKLQTIFDSQTKAMSDQVVQLQVMVPDCYFQIDLAYGLPLDLATGENYDTDHTLLWGPIGGRNACTTGATPFPTATPVASGGVTPTPRATVSVPENTPAPTATTVTGTGEAAPTPSETPLAGPAAPEMIPPPAARTIIAGLLPQTGKAGSLMTYVGALLITAGLFHIWLTQRHKLIKVSKETR